MTEPNDNVELRNALDRLRDSVAGNRAPDSLESKLIQAFRTQHARRTVGIPRWAWVPAAIAASVLAAVAWRLSTPMAVHVPPTAVAVATPPATLRNEPKLNQPAVAPARPTARTKARVTQTPRRRVQAPEKFEVAETPRQQEVFVEIPYAPPFSPYEGGQVVRLNMPGSSVRRLGLPVSVDRVQADVLLGNDGIARAIRLVSNSGLNSGR